MKPVPGLGRTAQHPWQPAYAMIITTLHSLADYKTPKLGYESHRTREKWGGWLTLLRHVGGQ